MKVLLAQFIDFAWVLYAACGLGAVFYIARAVSLQRRTNASLTAFEREAMGAQIARSWRIAVIFILIGVLLFAAQFYFLPQLPLDELEEPTPTMVGLSVTPSPAPTRTLISGAMPTITATAVISPSNPVPTVAATPTTVPTPTPEPVPSIGLNAQFGNVAILEGYDVATTEVSTGEGVGLILYWRALEGASTADYWVFTHLLSPEDQLIAQHDGAPMAGTRPTTSWQAGELVVDYHQMIFLEEALGYTGTAQIAVGLYNPAVPEERVQLPGGESFVLLPTIIDVVGP